MIVDDEEDIRISVGQIFEISGYEVTKAEDGNDCINKLERETPDIVILDIMMPGMSGWDVAARIKENPKWNDIPIVFLILLIPCLGWYGGATTGSHSAIVTLTTAQVNTLRNTPITVVAAQGANTWIELVSAVITYDYATAAFTVGADEDLVIEYADDTDATASIETTGFLDQGNDEMRFYPNVLVAGANTEASITQALRIFNTGSGETADGGGEVDVRVTYRVYKTGF